MWRVVFFCFENLTHCKLFYSKSAFQIIFSDSRWFIIKISTYIKEQLVEKWQGLEVQRLFTSVWHVFVSRLILTFGSCVLYGNWVLGGCDDYIFCTTNWFTKIYLEFKKRLVYKDFILKDTKLLVKLPRPSRKHSTFFISTNSSLLFLNCSILSAKTDSLVCIDLVFWKELNKCFLYFFLKTLFFPMLGVLSTPLFWWLNWTALCTLSKSFPFFLPLQRYLRSVYRQSTCW